jgi:ribosomal protein S24E
MESKSISQTKNMSLGRTEYILEVTSEKNPSKVDISSLLGSDVALTVVRQIKGSFGKDKFNVDAIVYHSRLDLIVNLSNQVG